MTLFGFCPTCGYPWYCMCRTCEPSAPAYVKEWEHSDEVADGMKCPECGEVANYDTLAWICEEVQEDMLKTMREMCEGCLGPCETCPLTRYTKPEKWFSKELILLRTSEKTCRTCNSSLCRFMNDESEWDRPRECEQWTPVNYHEFRQARFKREDRIAKGEWKE